MKLAVLLKGAALILAATTVVAPAMAHGFDDCTKEAKDKWKPQADAEAEAPCLSCAWSITPGIVGKLE